MGGLEAEESFDVNRFRTILTRSTSVSLLRPLGREEQADYGMDEPSAVVTLETGGDEPKSYTLTVGAQDPDDSSYVVKSSESPFYVRVSEFAVNDLVTRTRDGFMAATPTPTPDAGTPEAEGTPSP